MTNKPMRGVYPILVTPFDEAGRIDEESLRRLIDFNLDAGVHGLGWPSAARFSNFPKPNGIK
ncbi:MAG: dihydrodipicolinate synthase family protein [Caldilineaceae bacterium]